MESSKLSSYGRAYLPFDDLAKRVMAYGVMTTLGTRTFSAVELISGMLISGINCVIVTVGQKAQDEEDMMKKGAIAAAGLFFSTILISLTVGSLMNRVGLVATKGMLIRVACLNGFGEAVKMVFPLFLERISEAPGMPTTAKEVHELSGLNIQYMHGHYEDYRSMPSDVLEAFEDRLGKMSMLPALPSSVEEVEALGTFELVYMRNHFEDFRAMTPQVCRAFEKRLQPLELLPKMPTIPERVGNLDLFSAFYLKTHFMDLAEMSVEVRAAFDKRLGEFDLLPQVPENVEDVRSLGFFDVRYIFDNYLAYFKQRLEKPSDTDGHGLVIINQLEPPVLHALHLRFYHQDLPFPEDITVDSIENGDNQYPLVVVKLPQTVEDVEGLTLNQLSWLFGSIVQNNEEKPDQQFYSLDLNVQAALYVAFRDNLPEGWYYFPRPTIENVKEASLETAGILFDYYQHNLDRFICFHMELKQAFNEKFVSAEKTPLEQTYDLSQIRVRDKEADLWLRYFKNNVDAWYQCGPRFRTQFNGYFKEKGLEELEVPHMLPAPKEEQVAYRSFFGLFNY